MKRISGLVLLVVLLILTSSTQATVDLLVSSEDSDQILRYDGATGAFLGVFASGNGLDEPRGLAFGPDNNLYVCSNYTNAVLRFDGTSGTFVDTFASGNEMDYPENLLFGPDNNLYVSSYNSGAIFRYDGTTGSFIDIFVLGNGTDTSRGMRFGPDGNLYVCHREKISRYHGTTGTFMDDFVLPNSGGLLYPIDLTFGSDGDLYVSDIDTDQILRYDGTTGVFIDIFASGGSLDHPFGLAFGPDGHLYVSSEGTSSIKRYDGMTGAFIDDFVNSGSGGLLMPTYLVFTPEPSTPPIADADGPYTIYVGDTLMLDASGSTDADDNIVSYMWDLDDNNSFETDAGGQAIFDVNYTYLQSLGLLINHTYTIHLKVTDSEDQSDTADSTLTIVPKPAVQVAVDIKPGSCPNPLNVKSSGVLPVAILGTQDVNVLDIDPASIQLAGVGTIRSSFEDVATPVSDSNDCNCITDGPDGFLDLTLKFKTQRIVEAVGDVNDGDVVVLTLTGVLFDPMPFETPIEGADCILIRGRHKPINPADINKDGVVNAVDFAIFAQNWLQSSIVDE